MEAVINYCLKVITAKKKKNRELTRKGKKRRKTSISEYNLAF